MSFKLNEAQTKWLEALESGDYKQCEGALHIRDGYCCLGVGGLTLGFGAEKLLRNPYREIKEGLGLINELGHPLNKEFEPLYRLNDREMLSFADIAAHLRKYPEQYFTGGADD